MGDTQIEERRAAKGGSELYGLGLSTFLQSVVPILGSLQ